MCRAQSCHYRAGQQQAIALRLGDHATCSPARAVNYPYGSAIPCIDAPLWNRCQPGDKVIQPGQGSHMRVHVLLVAVWDKLLQTARFAGREGDHQEAHAAHTLASRHHLLSERASRGVLVARQDTNPATTHTATRARYM